MQQYQAGHITGLLSKVKPAIQIETSTVSDRTGKTTEFVMRVATNNVFLTVQKIREQSSVLAQMEQTKQIKIIGGLHNIDTGQVVFYR